MASRKIDLDDILEITATIVDAGGRTALSIGRLATDLGVQPSALYNHVDGIDGLWHDFAVHATDRLADILVEAAVGRSGGSALRAVGRAYREFAGRHPGQFASCMLPPSSAEDALNASHQRIVTVFSRVVAGFNVEPDQHVHVTRTVRAAIHGFVSLESIDGLPSPDDTDPSFEALLDFLVTGLGE